MIGTTVLASRCSHVRRSIWSQLLDLHSTVLKESRQKTNTVVVTSVRPLADESQSSRASEARLSIMRYRNVKGRLQQSVLFSSSVPLAKVSLPALCSIGTEQWTDAMLLAIIWRILRHCRAQSQAQWEHSHHSDLPARHEL